MGLRRPWLWERLCPPRVRGPRAGSCAWTREEGFSWAGGHRALIWEQPLFHSLGTMAARRPPLLSAHFPAHHWLRVGRCKEPLLYSFGTMASRQSPLYRLSTPPHTTGLGWEAPKHNTDIPAVMTVYLVCLSARRGSHALVYADLWLHRCSFRNSRRGTGRSLQVSSREALLHWRQMLWRQHGRSRCGGSWLTFRVAVTCNNVAPSERAVRSSSIPRPYAADQIISIQLLD